MRTNGFALFVGEGAPALALAAARRVKRYSREMLVSTGGGEFGELEAARLLRKEEEEAEAALAFSLEGRDFPLVHGYLSGDPARPRGEFSLVARGGGGGDGLYGARDILGTRGLWTLREGPNAGSFASDYRLLPGGLLLPPGTVYERGRAKVENRSEQDERHHVRSFDEAARTLAALIEESVRERVQGRGRVAISFSGGLDSSLLALVASKHSDVILCSAYAARSRDEKQTSDAAGLLGLKLDATLLEERALAERSAGAELPPGEATPMDEALWCIYSMTSELAKRSGARTILLGQLADELFGGYRKYSVEAHERGAAAAERMMRDDVRACADRGFLRDEAACSASCEVRFPYADASIASFAAGLPLSYKIRGGERKAVLRAAALELGLPEELAAAPKKAAQFSSGAAKLLRRRGR